MLGSNDTDITVYEWDHLNRLVAVTDDDMYAEYIADAFHDFLVVVIGTLTILLVGLWVSRWSEPVDARK